MRKSPYDIDKDWEMPANVYIDKADDEDYNGQFRPAPETVKHGLANPEPAEQGEVYVSLGVVKLPTGVKRELHIHRGTY